MRTNTHHTHSYPTYVPHAHTTHTAHAQHTTHTSHTPHTPIPHIHTTCIHTTHSTHTPHAHIPHTHHILYTHCTHTLHTLHARLWPRRPAGPAPPASPRRDAAGVWRCSEVGGPRTRTEHGRRRACPMHECAPLACHTGTRAHVHAPRRGGAAQRGAWAPAPRPPSPGGRCAL